MYVDITRGRNGNIAIATEHTLPDDQPHLPNGEPDLEHRIAATLERAKEQTAFELDPSALASASQHDRGKVSTLRGRSQSRTR